MSGFLSLSAISNTNSSISNSPTRLLQKEHERDGKESYLWRCNQQGLEPVREFLVALSDPSCKSCSFAQRRPSLTDADIVSICEVLRNNHKLEELDFESNKLGRAAAAELALVLSENNTLKVLRLGDNVFGGEGVSLICTALQRNAGLRFLDLRSNHTGSLGGKAAAQMLKVNNTLTDLNLQRNSLCDESCASLARALRTNPSLTSLNLRFNDIGDSGANALAELLKVNSVLRVLDLGGNYIQQQGGQSIAEALQTNSHLRKLNLRSNSIGNSTCNILRSSLQSNNTLSELYLGFNGIDEEGVILVSDGLRYNTGLKRLDLQGVVLGIKGVQSMSLALEHNTTLGQLIIELDPSCNEAATWITCKPRHTTALIDLALDSPTFQNQALNSYELVHSPPRDTPTLTQAPSDISNVSKTHMLRWSDVSHAPSPSLVEETMNQVGDLQATLGLTIRSHSADPYSPFDQRLSQLEHWHQSLKNTYPTRMELLETEHQLLDRIDILAQEQESINKRNNEKLADELRFEIRHNIDEINDRIKNLAVNQLDLQGRPKDLTDQLSELALRQLSQCLDDKAQTISTSLWQHLDKAIEERAHTISLNLVHQLESVKAQLVHQSNDSNATHVLRLQQLESQNGELLAKVNHLSTLINQHNGPSNDHQKVNIKDLETNIARIFNVINDMENKSRAHLDLHKEIDIQLMGLSQEFEQSLLLHKNDTIELQKLYNSNRQLLTETTNKLESEMQRVVTTSKDNFNRTLTQLNTTNERIVKIESEMIPKTSIQMIERRINELENKSIESPQIEILLNDIHSRKTSVELSQNFLDLQQAFKDVATMCRRHEEQQKMMESNISSLQHQLTSLQHPPPSNNTNKMAEDICRLMKITDPQHIATASNLQHVDPLDRVMKFISDRVQIVERIDQLQEQLHSTEGSLLKKLQRTEKIEDDVQILKRKMDAFGSDDGFLKNNTGEIEELVKTALVAATNLETELGTIKQGHSALANTITRLQEDNTHHYNNFKQLQQSILEWEQLKTKSESENNWESRFHEFQNEMQQLHQTTERLRTELKSHPQKYITEDRLVDFYSEQQPNLEKRLAEQYRTYLQELENRCNTYLQRVNDLHQANLHPTVQATEAYHNAFMETVGALSQRVEEALRYKDSIYELQNELHYVKETISVLRSELDRVDSETKKIDVSMNGSPTQLLEQLSQRVATVEQRLRQDQQASLLALEAILKDKTQPINAEGSTLHVSRDSPTKLHIQLPTTSPCSITARLSYPNSTSPTSQITTPILHASTVSSHRPSTPIIHNTRTNSSSLAIDNSCPPPPKQPPRPPSPAQNGLENIPSTNLPPWYSNLTYTSLSDSIPNWTSSPNTSITHLHDSIPLTTSSGRARRSPSAPLPNMSSMQPPIQMRPRVQVPT